MESGCERTKVLCPPRSYKVLNTICLPVTVFHRTSKQLVPVNLFQSSLKMASRNQTDDEKSRDQGSSTPSTRPATPSTRPATPDTDVAMSTDDESDNAHPRVLGAMAEALQSQHDCLEQIRSTVGKEVDLVARWQESLKKRELMAREKKCKTAGSKKKDTQPPPPPPSPSSGSATV